MAAKRSDTWFVACDFCGKKYTIPRHHGQGFREAYKSANWRSRKLEGVWHSMCPRCALKEKKMIKRLNRRRRETWENT